MAATGTRSASGVRAHTRAHPGELSARTPRTPAILGAGLAAAVAYAMFASGAIGLPQESRLQIGVAVLAFAALAALLFGRDLRLAGAPLAVPGIALLAGFAAWSGLSIAWSVAPDESWLELNRAIAYTLVAGLALALGSSLPRAAERVALGYLAIATAAALYALGGKLFPWVDIPGLIDLNQTEQFSRLRVPLEYWNALGLVCVLGVPVAVRAAVEAGDRLRARAAAHIALVVLLLTLGLTYSRGGLLALAVAVGALAAIGPERGRLAATAGIGLIGALPAFLFAITSDDLTANGVPVSDRTGEGLLLALLLLGGIAVALVLARALARRSRERRPASAQSRERIRRAAPAIAAAVPILLLAGLAFSDRGISGTISHQFDEFSEPKLDRQNDPARVLQTNSGNRYVWWEEAAGAFSDRPLVGYGAGSFPLVHRLYRKNLLEVRQPHNVPLEFLSETGLIGALLGLGGLALLGVAATRTGLARAPGRERGYAATLLVGAGAWGVHTLVDWDWDIPGVTLPALVFLGVLAARPPGTPRAGAAPVRAPGGGVALVLGGAAALVIIALAALPAIAKQLTNDALSQAASNTRADLTAAGEKAALAKRLNPYSVDPVFAQAAIAERGNQPAAAAGLLVEAVQRQPDNPATWSRLARFQVLSDDPGGARRSLLKTLQLDPATAAVYKLAPFATFDERRSASATGTPLPLPVSAPPTPSPFVPPPRRSPRPPRGSRPPQAPVPSPAPVPVPVAPPAPAPNPPTPAPDPAPPREPPAQQPDGEPFRLEG